MRRHTLVGIIGHDLVAAGPGELAAGVALCVEAVALNLFF
jgi:hypothetical protein